MARLLSGKKYLKKGVFAGELIEAGGPVRCVRIEPDRLKHAAAYFVTSAPVNPALIAGSSRFSTRLARTSPVLST